MVKSAATPAIFEAFLATVMLFMDAFPPTSLILKVCPCVGDAGAVIVMAVVLVSQPIVVPTTAWWGPAADLNTVSRIALTGAQPIEVL